MSMGPEETGSQSFKVNQLSEWSYTVYPDGIYICIYLAYEKSITITVSLW